jgi:hypothetical protein
MIKICLLPYHVEEGYYLVRVNFNPRIPFYKRVYFIPNYLNLIANKFCEQTELFLRIIY